MYLQNLVSIDFMKKAPFILMKTVFTKNRVSFVISKENKAISSLPETAFRIFLTINHHMSSVVQNAAFSQTGILKFRFKWNKGMIYYKMRLWIKVSVYYEQQEQHHSFSLSNQETWAVECWDTRLLEGKVCLLFCPLVSYPIHRVQICGTGQG